MDWALLISFMKLQVMMRLARAEVVVMRWWRWRGTDLNTKQNIYKVKTLTPVLYTQSSLHSQYKTDNYFLPFITEFYLIHSCGILIDYTTPTYSTWQLAFNHTRTFPKVFISPRVPFQQTLAHSRCRPQIK